MSRCTDADVGALLHAFELGVLTEEERDRFSAHLLECEHCFERLQHQRSAIELLRHDADIRSDVQALANNSEQAEADPIPWYRQLVARPLMRFALAAILILAVGLPVYRAVHNRGGGMQVLQTVTLLPTRSAGTNIIKLGHGDAVDISFQLPGANRRTTAQVTLLASDGHAVFENGAFGSFDSSGVGRIIVPLHLLHPGVYQLQLRDRQVPPAVAPRTYVVLVKPADTE